MRALWMLLLVGCGPDPALVAERDQLADQVEQLTVRNSRLEREADTLHAQLQQLKTELKRARRDNVFATLGITEGQTLVGYIRRGETKATYFSKPLKTWSPARRKFRDLTKKELSVLCL